MNVIWKYELSLGTTKIDVPYHHKVLTAQVQSTVYGESIMVWMLLNLDQPKTDTVEFEVIPTGLPFDGMPAEYLGTVQQANGALIWHIFYKEII